MKKEQIDNFLNFLNKNYSGYALIKYDNSIKKEELEECYERAMDFGKTRIRDLNSYFLCLMAGTSQIKEAFESYGVDIDNILITKNKIHKDFQYEYEIYEPLSGTPSIERLSIMTKSQFDLLK
ncbi:hypothetical protein [Caldiplasma sukawensis]